MEKLARAQAARRAPVEAARADMVARQERERATQLRDHLAARQALRAGYLAEVARVRQQREEARPTGLAAFLGRVTGVSAIIHRVQRYKDAKRYLAFRESKQGIVRAQRVETAPLQRRHKLQALDMNRQLKALTAVEARELKALEESIVREQRLKERAGHEHMPALALELKPRGRSASVRRAKDRYRDRTGRDHARDEERAMRARMAEEEKRLEPDAAEIDLKDAHREALERQEPWARRWICRGTLRGQRAVRMAEVTTGMTGRRSRCGYRGRSARVSGSGRGGVEGMILRGRGSAGRLIMSGRGAPGMPILGKKSRGLYEFKTSAQGYHHRHP